MKIGTPQNITWSKSTPVLRISPELQIISLILMSSFFEMANAKDYKKTAGWGRCKNGDASGHVKKYSARDWFIRLLGTEENEAEVRTSASSFI